MGREVGGRFKRERTYVYLWLIVAPGGSVVKNLPITWETQV